MCDGYHQPTPTGRLLYYISFINFSFIYISIFVEVYCITYSVDWVLLFLVDHRGPAFRPPGADRMPGGGGGGEGKEKKKKTKRTPKKKKKRGSF